MVVGLILIAILAVLVAVIFRKIAKINKYVDDLYNMHLMSESVTMNHGKRPDAHYKDIVNLSSCLSDLEHNQTSKVVIDTKKDVDKRREKFAHLRNELNVKEAGEQMDISPSTAKRYETWRKNNKK
jgi:hypothetical protein